MTECSTSFGKTLAVAQAFVHIASQIRAVILLLHDFMNMTMARVFKKWRMI